MSNEITGSDGRSSTMTFSPTRFVPWIISVVLAVDVFLLVWCGWSFLRGRQELASYLGLVASLTGLCTGISSHFITCRLRVRPKLGITLWSVSGITIVIITIAILCCVFDLCSPRCSCPAATETATLLCLVEAEAEAVLNVDMNLIIDIYLEEASVRNEATDKEKNVDAYYLAKFENEVHCEIDHYKYEVLKLERDKALVTTGSRGSWGFKEEGCTRKYDNPPGSDRWYFSRDTEGCWRISKFVFNANAKE